MKNIKSNRGVSITDVVIALIILTIFTGVIGNLIYQIAYNNAALRVNAIVADYAVKEAEYIDKIAYEDVQTSNEKITKINGEDVLDAFTVKLDVEDYKGNDETKQDIIKKVTITVNYNILKDEKSYKIEKLKIKEM